MPISQLPFNIAYALDRFPYNTSGEQEESERYLASFAQRWGSVDTTALTRAVRGDHEPDRIFALLALGYTGTQEARELLLPFLESHIQVEKWVSALELGKLGEPRAFPVLFDMLTGFTIPEQHSTEKRYNHPWLFSVASILGAIGIPSAVPPLRHALQKAVNAELTIPDISSEERVREGKRILVRRRTHRDGWIAFEDEIVYALGRLGAFGVLTGLTNVEAHLPLWRVHLVMGHLHGQYPITGLLTWKEMPELLEKVTQMLEQCFGLDADMIAGCLGEYEWLKGAKVSGIYETERLRVEGRIY